MTGSLLVRFTLDTELARDGRAALLQFCFDELGCSYHWVGDDQGEYLYMTDDDPNPVHTEDRDDAVAAVVEAEGGVIGLSYRDVAATLHFSPAADADLELPRVTVAVDDYHFKPSRGYDPAQAREFLLESPAWRVDECDDGGVFVWLSPSPWTTPEYADDVAAAEQYFGFEREEL